MKSFREETVLRWLVPVSLFLSLGALALELFGLRNYRAEKAELEVATIADLRGISATKLSDNQAAQVLGYSAAGDGGGGVFRYDAASAAAADDGTIFAPTRGSGRWIRVFSGPVNVLWFGATRDDSASATGAINRAIASAFAQNRRAPEIFIPGGTYLITAPGIIAHDGKGNGCTITGEAKNAVKLDIQTGPKAAGLIFANQTAYGRGGAVRRLQLWSPSTTESGDHIVVSQWNNLTLEEINIHQPGGAGIHIVTSTHIGAQNMFIEGCGTSGIAVDSSDKDISTTCSFRNIYITGSRYSACDIGGLNVNFSDCIFESNGFETGAEAVRQRDGCSTFTGCYFEDNRGDDMVVGYNAPAPWSLSGAVVTMINPFFQYVAHKQPGKGGVLVNRGQFVFIGPGSWYNSARFATIKINKPNGATCQLIGLPVSLAPEPSYTDGTALPPSFYGTVRQK